MQHLIEFIIGRSGDLNSGSSCNFAGQDRHQYHVILKPAPLDKGSQLI
jgi:hypothetical protein